MKKRFLYIFLYTVLGLNLLIGAQISMRQFCTLCMGTHLVNVSATAIGTSGCAFTYVGQLPTAPVCIAARPVLNRFAVPNSAAASSCP